MTKNILQPIPLIASVALVLSVACTPLQPAAPTHDPNDPLPTYADPAKQAIIAQNTADALHWQNTQIAIERASTVAAATHAWMNAQAAVLAATQRVDQQNAWATQQAVSVAQTATAGAVNLLNQQAAITQTAVAMGQTFSVATQQAAIAEQQSIAAIEKERAASAGQLNTFMWQTFQVVMMFVLGVAAIAVIVIGGAAFFYWLKVKIEMSRVLPEYGLVVAPGEIYRLPGYEREALPAGAECAVDAVVIEDAEPRPEPVIRQRDGTHIPASEAIARSQERALRTAWRNAAFTFLRWAEYPDADGEPQGFALRAMREHGYTDDQWRALVGLLAGMGFLVKADARPNAAWVMARKSGGESLMAREVMQNTAWLTSFEVPETIAPPEIAPPPARNALAHDTTQQTPTNTAQHGTTRTTQNNGGNAARIVEMPETPEERKRQRYGAMGPPRLYEDLMKDLEEGEEDGQ
ncbi:MAG: hypothetical protein JXB47_09945 [Anaerolineae bacterium]|nr:hypothetical protein [Anaerolineae bacterium]